MQERIFRFDIPSHEWTECTDKKYGAGDPECIPRFVVVSEQEDTMLPMHQKVWCETHQMYEEVTGWQDDTVTTSAGCRMWGFAAEVMNLGESANDSGKPATICWRVSQREDGTVFIGRVNGWISTLRCWEVQRKELVEVPYWSLGPSQGLSLHLFPKQIFPQKPSISIPSIVADAAIDYLLDEAESHYGKRPRLPACARSGSLANGTTRLLAFLDYPFHIALWHYKDFFGSSYQKKSLAEDEEDIFPYLCEGLNLQPTEELRAQFERTPMTLAVTALLRVFGVKTPSLVDKFMDKETFFGESPAYVLHYKLNQYLFSSPQRGIFSSDLFKDDKTARSFLKGVKATYDGWEEMLFYCRWRLFKEGEERLASHLRDMDAHWTPRFMKAAKLFCHNYSDLSTTFRDDLLREGLTVEMHNRMIRKINEKAIGKPDFSYSAAEKRYECRIGDYTFRLIKNNTDYRAVLAAAAIDNHNCLDQPDNGVLRVAMYKNEKIVAVILLSGAAKFVYDLHLGGYHELQEANLRIAYLRWMNWTGLYKKHGLFYEEDYPYLMEEVHAEPLESAPSSLYEMLRLPEEKIRHGYYTQLYRMLKEACLQTFIVPPRHPCDEFDKYLARLFSCPEPIRDSEMDYLMRIFPYGERIYKAAFRGVREAQKVLSLCYEDGYHAPLLPKDEERAKYWANATED